MTFGATSLGFVRKTLADIKLDFETQQRATVSPILDVSTESFVGQQNGIYARELALVWEQIEVAYNAFDPDKAEGLLLRMLCKLTGTYARAATYSEVTQTCNLNPDVELESGTHFVAILGKETVRFTPKANFTGANGAGAPANYDIVFRAENTGPVAALAGTLTVVATPVSGWNSTTNAEDAELGRVMDDDYVLNVRRARDLAAAGSATVRAIRSDLEDLAGIETADVFENDTDYFDADSGRPPHSIEALVYDGEVPAVSNDDIAQAIWDAKAGGVATYGGSTGEAVINAIGTTKLVNFSRVSRPDVYINYSITIGPDYVGDVAVKEYVVAQCEARFKAADDVTVVFTKALPTQLTGVKDVTGFAIGFAPGPIAEANLFIDTRQRAGFDTSRVNVSITPDSDL